jgi:hypothetical protein
MTENPYQPPQQESKPFQLPPIVRTVLDFVLGIFGYMLVIGLVLAIVVWLVTGIFDGDSGWEAR